MDDLEGLLDQQAGMVARRQLKEHGIGWDPVEHHIRARRWVARTPRVISTTTGQLSRDQRFWLAVLHAGPRSLLGGLTAAERHGLKRWERDVVTVLVDDELDFEPVEGVHFFRSRRPFELLRHPGSALPVARIEPAVLMWAGYDAPPRPAHAVLAACVQQRLTTAERLLEWTYRLKPLRRAPGFRETLADIAGGAHSGAELDVARMCRGFHLVPPARQRGRFDRAGRRRWTDCEWDFPDGSVLVLEVDGAFHMDVENWDADLKRSRRITRPGRRTVVRCSAYELRHETVELVADLVALGVPRTAACA
jgi:hypothetical protein